MKKAAVIYWSSGGNVERLANNISDELEANDIEVYIEHVSDANITNVLEADVVAFGSPSMDNNRIEQHEMEPFIKQFETLNNNKKLILFGSYGWDEGKFMDAWVTRMKNYGFDVVGYLAVKESPSEEEIKRIKNLAKNLIG